MHMLSSLLNLPTILAQAPAQPEISGAAAAGGIIGIVILGLFSLVLFVFLIMALVKQFQNDPAWHGIIGIITCGLYTYIWGWINSTRLNLKKFMLIWTVVWVLGFLANIIFAGAFAALVGSKAMEAERVRQSQPAPEQN